jgi:hypothetical protein
METPHSENPPPKGEDEFNSEKIQKELDELRLLTIVSERRAVPAFLQLRKYWPNRKSTQKEEYKKAVEAFTWTALSLIFPGGGSGGFLTVLIAVATIYLGMRSNQLQKQSNSLVDRQILVEDASRRATISAELTAILDQINDYQIVHPESKTMPSTIVARIMTATKAMHAYEQPGNELPHFPQIYSPERSQLLSVLANLHLSDYRPILEGSDFSHSVVPELRMDGATAILGGRFSNCWFDEATFSRDTLVRADFSHSRIQASQFFHSDFSGSDFSSAVFRKVRIKSSQFTYCNFNQAMILGVVVDDPESFKEASFIGAQVDQNFFDEVLKPLQVDEKSVHIIRAKQLR